MAEKQSGPRIKLDPGDRIGAKGKGGKKSRIHWLVHFFLLVVLFFGVIGAGTWYLLESGPVRERETINAPLIKADAEPYKVRPIDPGGMEVPGRDRLVYDRLSEGGGAGAVESLLPPPEDRLPPPGPKEKVIAEFGGDKKPAPALSLAPTPVPAPAPPPAPPPAPEVVPETTKKPEPVKELAKAPVKVAPAPAPTPAPAPVSDPIAGGALVQLASVREETAVSKEWARLKKAHTDLLGGLRPMVQRADLGAKGIFYRLRAGPLSDDGAARALCAQLKQRNVPCIPVRPPAGEGN